MGRIGRYSFANFTMLSAPVNGAILLLNLGIVSCDSTSAVA
jgi:hypothetical protein